MLAFKFDRSLRSAAYYNNLCNENKYNLAVFPLAGVCTLLTNKVSV